MLEIHTHYGFNQGASNTPIVRHVKLQCLTVQQCLVDRIPDVKGLKQIAKGAQYLELCVCLSRHPSLALCAPKMQDDSSSSTHLSELQL